MQAHRRDPVATAGGRPDDASPVRCRSPVPVPRRPTRARWTTALLSAGLLAATTPSRAAGGDFAELEAVAATPAPTLAAAPGAADPLAAHAGRPVVINFWATWCEPCRDEMPALEALRTRRPDVAVITVAVADSEAKVRRFAEDYRLDLPVILDPDQTLARPWDVRVLPITVVLDASHRVRYRAVGALDWRAPRLDALLTGLASGAAAR